MQFSSVFTLLTIAMTAAAAPAEVVARTTITPGSCTIPNYKPYCCQSLSSTGGGVLGGLLGLDLSAALACTVGVIGGQCNASVKCCKSDATNNGNALIFINALNCAA
ncbi:hypothetical protein N0V85_009752 [Neurospora sp. IMI 360204]|nr:hypothetical protein N0V85_009752 [Neurospora sp. IMI 360204]